MYNIKYANFCVNDILTYGYKRDDVSYSSDLSSLLEQAKTSDVFISTWGYFNTPYRGSQFRIRWGIMPTEVEKYVLSPKPYGYDITDFYDGSPSIIKTTDPEYDPDKIIWQDYSTEEHNDWFVANIGSYPMTSSYPKFQKISDNYEQILTALSEFNYKDGAYGINIQTESTGTYTIYKSDGSIDRTGPYVGAGLAEKKISVWNDGENVWVRGRFEYETKITFTFDEEFKTRVKSFYYYLSKYEEESAGNIWSRKQTYNYSVSNIDFVGNSVDGPLVFIIW